MQSKVYTFCLGLYTPLGIVSKDIFLYDKNVLFTVLSLVTAINFNFETFVMNITSYAINNF